jgi:deoxyribodipyrimidine photo-lyase
LRTFLPDAGRHYSRARNHDLGPSDRSNVSALSPWIRHRLVSEREVVQAVLGRHSFGSAEKFVQEVLWRTYWKGWLEMRPTVWTRYRGAVERWERELAADDGLNSRFFAATEGRTGIQCFDGWTRELVQHGYLHNHARMWFASIWIFTLKLPWELGADFFMRFLLDGDPASNTLSWRWVAGLQTPGKTYLARPANIAKFASKPLEAAEGLATVATPLAEPPPPPAMPLPSVTALDPDLPSALLVTEEDCQPETLDVPPEIVTAIAGLVCARARSPFPVGNRPVAFAHGAVADATARAAARFECPKTMLAECETGDDFARWIRDHGIRQVVTAYAPVGPTREALFTLETRLSDMGASLVFVRREWDEVFWPHATKGFFPFKDRIPRLLGEVFAVSMT